VHLDTASFTETGGVSALAGTGNREDVGYSTLGARLATNYLLQNGMALIPRVSVAWQHAFGDVTPTAALSFQSIGAGFNILGVPIARDAALVEAAAICSSPRRPRSASPMRANSPTVRTTIRSRAISPGGFDFRSCGLTSRLKKGKDS
jgi:hypothetical protein